MKNLKIFGLAWLEFSLCFTLEPTDCLVIILGDHFLFLLAHALPSVLQSIFLITLGQQAAANFPLSCGIILSVHRYGRKQLCRNHRNRSGRLHCPLPVTANHKNYKRKESAGNLAFLPARFALRTGIMDVLRFSQEGHSHYCNQRFFHGA